MGSALRPGNKFANHQTTSVGADGNDIESVTMRLKTHEPAEEAFAAIEKLTDADVDIDNETEVRSEPEKGAGLASGALF